MRRFAPVGLAILLLLLLIGCGSGVGSGGNSHPMCTVGCILDVYPCIDPMTNRPASEGRSGCSSQSLSALGTTREPDPLLRSLAAAALLLAVAALSLLVVVWWVIGRARRKVPDLDDEPSEVADQLALPGLFGSASAANPSAPTSVAGSVRRLLPIGFVLVGIVVVGALALWVLHRPLYYLNQFCAEPVDYIDVLMGAPVQRVPIDEACTVGFGSRSLAVGAMIFAAGCLAFLSLLWRWLDPDRARKQPDGPLPDDATSTRTPDPRQTRLRRFAPVVVAVVILGGLAGWQAVSSRFTPHGSIMWQLSGYGGPGLDPATARTTTVLKVFVAQWPADELIGDSWLAAPEVSYAASSVTIRLRPSDAYRSATQRNNNRLGFYDTGGWVEVHLTEPLLGRALFDGSTFPPAARPYPTVAEASAAAARASARASAAAAEAAANAPAASAAAAAQASAAAARASADAQVAQRSCSIKAGLSEARVIVLGDGSRTECEKLAEAIDLGSGARMNDLRRPAEAPTGGLMCHATVDRWDVSVYDTGSATVGEIACRYLVPKPYLGIVVQEVAEGLRLKDTTGPTGRVSAVYPGGPGSKAGLKTGDIVTRIDDTSIPTADDLDTIVASHHIGDTLHLDVLRSGQTLPWTLSSRRVRRPTSEGRCRSARTHVPAPRTNGPP